MKTLKWIIFLPAAFLGYYLSVIILSLIKHFFTFPPPRDNPLVFNYILPIVINVVGVFTYYYIGNKIIQSTNNDHNLIQRKISNILMLILILSVSIIFAYISFNENEYFEGIVSIINILASIVAFSMNYSDDM